LEAHAVLGSKSINSNISMTILEKSTRLPACMIVLAALVAPGFAQGSTATLADGTTLTIRTPLQPFGTEGPIWKLDASTKEIFAMGHNVTIPATVDGATISIGGTSDGLGGEISASTFDRLLDVNAAPGGRDTNGTFTGAARSILSTDLAQAQLPTTHAQMEAQFDALFNAAITAHPTVVLPPESITAAYPRMTGGTLKCAGHVYEDAAGNSYFIPDLELVIELAENVVGGTVVSSHPGGAGTPASFVVGGLLLVMNQDPRFTASISGLGGVPLSEEDFFAQLGLNPTAPVSAIGHLIGDHLMLVQEIETELINPGAGVQITAEKFKFKNSKDEIRIRGTVDKPEGLTLRIQFLEGTTVLHDFAEPMVVDPLVGPFAEYDARSKEDVDVEDVDAVSIYVLDAAGIEVARETFLRADVE